MTIHIQLPPEAETRLLERAAAEGKAPDEFAAEAIREKLGMTNGGPLTPDSRAAAWNRFVSNMVRLSQGLPPGYIIDDSRDSIYGDRGE